MKTCSLIEKPTWSAHRQKAAGLHSNTLRGETLLIMIMNYMPHNVIYFCPPEDNISYQMNLSASKINF